MENVLTEEQIDSFQLNGYLLLAKFYGPEELDSVRRDTAELIERGLAPGFDDRNYVFHAKQLCLFRINKLLEANKRESFQSLLGNPRLLTMVSQLFQGDHFGANQQALVFKLPGPGNSAPIPWHQDPVPVYRFPLFNVDIYLDAATPENGCLHTIPRSHLQGYQSPSWVQAVTGGKAEDAPGAIPVPTEPGDVLVHATTLLHGSYYKNTDQIRRTVYFHFDHLEDVKLREPDDYHRKQYAHSQRRVLEAIEVRKRLYPDDEAFPYEKLDIEEILAV